MIIALIYLLAISIGIAVFTVIPGSLIFRVFIADVAATLLIWVISVIIKNASLYDPYWSVVPPVILILVMIHEKINPSLSVFLLLTAMMIWSVRLTYNWARNWKGFHEVDWRYAMIKEKSPKLFPLTNLFGIQLMPTSIVYIQLILGIKVIQENPFITPLIVIGSLVIVMGAMIQYIADSQMMKHRMFNQDTRRVIDFGLWKYSRHPNYFGELSVWWGLYAIYLGTFKTLDVLILPPVLMTLLFLLISIPMMEKKMLSTRPEYKDYQMGVSMLIPFMKKKHK